MLEIHWLLSPDGGGLVCTELHGQKVAVSIEAEGWPGEFVLWDLVFSFARSALVRQHLETFEPCPTLQ